MRLPTPARRSLLALVAALALFPFACGDGGRGANPTPSPTSTERAASPTATPTPPPTPTAVDLGPPQPDEARILEHIRVLAEQIGSRPAGTAREQAAVAYAQAQLERWGYQVEVQGLDVTTTPRMPRAATLAVEGPTGREIAAAALRGGAAGEVRGRLVDAGLGREGDFPREAQGAIVLFQRGEVFFTDMARQARDAGALAVVIANREPGLFQGDLDPPSDLPVVAIDQAAGAELRALLAQGREVEARLTVAERYTARNVIARRQGAACRTLSGGHFDSVPVAAGANDNASGSALVLELARAAAAAGLQGHCFALFASEETGLHGSKHLVTQLSEEERAALLAVFNYDVVASNAPPLLIGDPGLADRAQEAARQLGIEAERASPDDVASDHLSFLNAGIPALMLTTPEFELIHTPQDTFENLKPTFLRQVASLGFALLQQLEATP